MNQITSIVVSDLHIAAGALDDFDKELQIMFVKFLDELAARSMPTELIINGDFLDFVQADPWKLQSRGGEGSSDEELFEAVSAGGVLLCFTEAQSVRKLRAIIAAHEPVFDALARLLAANPENSLVILPGNHDADFYWEQVRELMTNKLCRRSLYAQRSDADGRVNGGGNENGNAGARPEQIRFHLDQAYRPQSSNRVWIEHGHQHDPLNSFFNTAPRASVSAADDADTLAGAGEPRAPESLWSEATPPILKDTNGQPRLYECTGTRLLLRFLNGLDANYPFVDNVKPFSRFLRIFGAAALTPGYGPFKASVVVWAMLRFIAATLRRDPGELLSLETTIKNAGQVGDNSEEVLKMTKAVVNGMSSEEHQAFTRRLKERGLPINQPLQMYAANSRNAEKLLLWLADNPDLLDELSEFDSVKKKPNSLLSIGGGGGTLSLKRGFNVNETQELRAAAERIREGGDVDMVIMGHTHATVRDPRYINTGCWTRYYTFADDDNKLRTWDILKQNSYEKFPYELNYVEITAASNVSSTSSTLSQAATADVKFKTFRERKSS